MKDKIKKFIKTPLGSQLYSFLKTYLTVFLALYLRDVVEGTQEGGDIIIWNLPVIIPAAKWSLIAVLRNVFKLLTEENK